MSVIEVVREERVPAGVGAVRAAGSDAGRAGEWSGFADPTEDTESSLARPDGLLS